MNEFVHHHHTDYHQIDNQKLPYKDNKIIHYFLTRDTSGSEFFYSKIAQANK